MTDMLCGYANRDETIVAFLYDELEPGERRDFNAHLLTCTVCRDEVAGLRAVRTQLARWEPPALTSLQSPVPGDEPPPVVAGSSRQQYVLLLRSSPCWRELLATTRGGSSLGPATEGS